MTNEKPNPHRRETKTTTQINTGEKTNFHSSRKTSNCRKAGRERLKKKRNPEIKMTSKKFKRFSKIPINHVGSTNN